MAESTPLRLNSNRPPHNYATFSKCITRYGVSFSQKLYCNSDDQYLVHYCYSRFPTHPEHDPKDIGKFCAVTTSELSFLIQVIYLIITFVSLAPSCRAPNLWPTASPKVLDATTHLEAE